MMDQLSYTEWSKGKMTGGTRQATLTITISHFSWSLETTFCIVQCESGTGTDSELEDCSLKRTVVNSLAFVGTAQV